MEEYKQWLEQQIEHCLNDKDLQREHWAFCKAYEKFTALQQTDVSGSLSFKEQIINDIIPFVERMIEKEKEHLYWLENKNAPKEFIEKSKLYLNHFRQRHKEYIEYADSLS